MIWRINMPHLPHFMHNKKFTFRYKTVTLNNISMPAIRYNFRKIEQRDFCSIYPILGITTFVLKNSNSHFKQFLIPAIRYHFRKIQRPDLEKNFKVLILGPKITHFLLFGHNKDFSSKSKSITLTHFFHTCKNVQVQKNLMNRF